MGKQTQPLSHISHFGEYIFLGCLFNMLIVFLDMSLTIPHQFELNGPIFWFGNSFKLLKKIVFTILPRFFFLKCGESGEECWRCWRVPPGCWKETVGRDKSSTNSTHIHHKHSKIWRNESLFLKVKEAQPRKLERENLEKPTRIES